MDHVEPILKEHTLDYPAPFQQPDDNSWVFACICSDCGKVMNMKFHGMDVDRIGKKTFSALWARACRLTLETTLCEPEKDPETPEENDGPVS